MLSTESGRRAEPRGQLYRVCWESSVTQVHGRSAPMSRDQAEFLARDEAIGTASCRFWIEPLRSARDEDDAEAESGVLARRTKADPRGQGASGTAG